MRRSGRENSVVDSAQASCGGDGELRLWDAPTGEARALRRPRASADLVEVSLDGAEPPPWSTRCTWSTGELSICSGCPQCADITVYREMLVGDR